MDRISELPEFILLSILSCLPTNEAAQTKLLSRRWLRLWQSFPILDFHPAMMFGKDQSQVTRKDFNKYVKFVDDSIQRFVSEKLRMKKLALCLSFLDADLVDTLNRWITMAVASQIEELDLQVCQHMYTLPQIVFSASCIKALTLHGCKFVQPVSIEFVLLRRLILQSVQLEERMLHRLVAQCPYIEDLVLKDIRGLKILEFSGLYLKNVEVTQVFGLDVVNFEAPKLEKLVFESASLWLKWKIRAASLEDLSLRFVNITYQFLDELTWNFPRLHRLVLHSCYIPGRLKISSHRLSTLVIKSCRQLRQLDIEAPNLREFKYQGNKLSHFRIIAPECIAIRP